MLQLISAAASKLFLLFIKEISICLAIKLPVVAETFTQHSLLTFQHFGKCGFFAKRLNILEVNRELRLAAS